MSKPNCGCCSEDFEIVSVKHVEGTMYKGQFNGCNVNPIVWVIRQGCVDFAAGDDTPISGGFFDLDLNGVPDGDYEIFASSPNCIGFGRMPDGKKFAVTHNNGIIVSEEDEEPLATPTLSATGVSDSAIRVNWAHPGGADEFQLQYLVGDGWANVDGGTFAGDAREATTTPWASNTEFTFRIRAGRDGAYSEWSNSANATAVKKDCQETLSVEKQSAFDGFATANAGNYEGNFTATLYRNNTFYFKQIGAFSSTTPTAVASLSKQFAAALILILVEEGKFANGLNTTVGSLIGSMQSAGKGAITLKQLMSHTSGMKANSNEGYESNGGLTSSGAVDLIAANVPLEHTPGSYYEYGGVHWCIAARMAEVATGQSWIQLCESRLWGPLGMDVTSYSSATNPMIHAGIITSISDFGRFMQMRLKMGVYNGTRIMSEAAVLSMETDQTGGISVYGFGVYPGDGVENFHNAATSCMAWLNREKKYFGLIFTNVANSNPVPSQKNDEFRDLVRNTIGAPPNCDETYTDEEDSEPPLPPAPNLDVDFVFITNTTGYFGTNDFNAKLSGLAPSCKVVRFCIRWDEYETAPGVYRTDLLAEEVAQTDAIYAAAGQPAPYYAINFWGVRHDDKIDQFLPYDDIVVFQGGKRATGGVVGERVYGLGSLSSTAYRKRVNDCAYSIAAWFATNAPGRGYYAAYSNGQTEERYNYLWDNPDSPYNFEAHGDFSATSLKAWRLYCQGRFGTTTPWGEASASATLPTAEWDTYHQPWVVSAMISGGKGKVWADFISKEMLEVVIGFKNAIKSGDSTMAVIDFIADFYRNQANGWLVNSISVHPIVEELDGLYHSDGDIGGGIAYVDGEGVTHYLGGDGDWLKKSSSFDSMIPTWGPDKLYFCEMDYVDMNMGFGDPYLPDPEYVKRVARAVYRKGGTGIHYAMSVTGAQAAVINTANLEILAEIEAGTLTRLDRSTAPNFTFDLSPMVYGGGEELLNYYKTTAGGTESNVVNLKLIKNY